MMGMGENPEREKVTIKDQGKKFPVWLPSHSPVYDMVAECFPVSKNTENKPELP